MLIKFTLFKICYNQRAVLVKYSPNKVWTDQQIHVCVFQW